MADNADNSDTFFRFFPALVSTPNLSYFDWNPTCLTFPAWEDQQCGVQGAEGWLLQGAGRMGVYSEE